MAARRALLLLLPGLLLAAACSPGPRRAGDVAVTLVSDPRPPRVGDALLLARVARQDGPAGTVSGVRFHYYPFVHRVKDSLASPDEAVRVVDGERAEDGYRARVTFDRAGPWKVTLKIFRPEGPEVILTFTLDVRA